MNKSELEKIIIVVDMVNGFVREGAMADSYIEHIIPEIVKIVEGNKENTIFIKDCHEKGCSEFACYPEHCLKGTSESELVEEFKKYENKDNTYEKNSTSAMFANNFINDIDKMKKLKEVIIVGCCTDICVLNLAIPLNNYFNQTDRKIEIKIPINAVETYNSDMHNRDEYNEIAFKLLKQAGIKLI